MPIGLRALRGCEAGNEAWDDGEVARFLAFRRSSDLLEDVKSADQTVMQSKHMDGIRVEENLPLMVARR